MAVKYKVNEVDYIFIPEDAVPLPTTLGAAYVEGGGNAGTNNTLGDVAGMSEPVTLDLDVNQTGLDAEGVGSAPAGSQLSLVMRPGGGLFKSTAGATGGGLFNIVDYGAIGDCVVNGTGGIVSGTDNTAALVAAIAAVTAAGGGTVFVPEGNYRLQSVMNAISLQLYGMEIVFRGVGSNSRFYFDAAGLEPFAIDATLASVRFDAMTFVGNGTDNCAFYAMVISLAQSLVFEECLFFGIKTGSPTGLYFNQCDQVAFLDTNLIGCGSQYNTDGLVGCYGSALAFVRSHCFDDGPVGGASGPIYTSELSLTTGAWVFIQNPQLYPTDGVQNNGRLYFEDAWFDENPIRAINIAPTSTNRWMHVELNGVRVNCSSQGSVVRAIGIAQCNTVRIRNTQVAYNTTQPAIGLELIDAGDVLIDGYETNTLTQAVKIDSLTACVRFRDSFGQYVIQFASTPIPCFDETSGIISRWALADGAVVANTLGKMSTGTAGDVKQLQAADSAALVVGGILDASAGGTLVRVVEVAGQVTPLKSDGTGTIAIGQGIDPSTTVNGRVVAGAGLLGYNAGAAVAATLDAIVEVL